MLGIGLPELFVLAVLALIVFGPERLPDLAAKAARTVKALRSQATKAMSDLNVESEAVTKTLNDLQSLRPSAIIGDVVGGVMGTTSVSSSPVSSRNRDVRLEAVFDPDAT